MEQNHSSASICRSPHRNKAFSTSLLLSSFMKASPPRLPFEKSLPGKGRGGGGRGTKLGVPRSSSLSAMGEEEEEEEQFGLFSIALFSPSSPSSFSERWKEGRKEGRGIPREIGGDWGNNSFLSPFRAGRGEERRG